MFASVTGANAATFFVNPVIGNNSFDGSQATIGTFPRGPKKTINAAMAVAASSDNISLANGTYNESVKVTNGYTFLISTGATVKSIIMDAPGKSLNLIGLQLNITDSLFLRNGTVDVSTGIVLLLKNGCFINNGSKVSYVDGRLFRENSALSGNLYFPVGDKKVFRPIRLQFTQSNTSVNTYGAQLFYFAPPSYLLPSGIKNVSELQYWETEVQGSASVSAIRVSLNYDTASSDDGVFQPSKLRVVKVNSANTAWLNLEGTGTTNRAGVIASALNASEFGTFTLANADQGGNLLGRQSPVNKFGIVGKCQGSAIQFKDSSFSYPTSVTSWRWDFGDPLSTSDTSILQNPTYIFSGTSLYNITLITRNAAGFRDTLVVPFRPETKPDADFTATNACKNNPVTFKDKSTVSPGYIKTRAWDFGNGDTRLNDSSFNYIYANAGNFNAKLIVSAHNGCTDTVVKKVVISSLPSLDVQAKGICIGETTELKGVSNNASDTISSWVWKIGNALLGGGQTLNNNFGSPATFQIKLIATNQFGCTDSVVKPITIYEGPVVKFWLDKSITPNDSVQCFKYNTFSFYNASYEGQGQSHSSRWEFSDSTVLGLENGVKSFARGSVFDVKLIVTTNRGCKDSITQQYRVKNRIVPSMVTYLPCFPAQSAFVNKSNSGGPGFSSVSWKFSDGPTASGDSVIRLFASAGAYSANLYLATNDGCFDTLSRNFNVTGSPVPVLGFSGPLSFCPGDSVRVTVGGGSNIRWTDNNDTSRVRVLKQSGRKTFRVFAGVICFEDSAVTVNVYNTIPTFAGNDTVIVRGRYALLNATGGLTLKWFGPAIANDTARNTVAYPNQKSQYILITRDQNNCVGTDSLWVDVKDPDFVKIPNMITPNGDGKNEVWDLTEVPFFTTCKITILDQWGGLVYSADKDYKNDWKGTRNGVNLPEGTYLYVVECPGEKQPYKGFVQIIR